MSELEKLKKRLLNSKSPSEKDECFALVEVMKVVGGYDQLLNLPLPTLRVILEKMDKEAKQQKKAYRKAKAKKPRKR